MLDFCYAMLAMPNVSTIHAGQNVSNMLTTMLKRMASEHAVAALKHVASEHAE